MSTATARTVLKIGEELRSNREVAVVESGESYDIEDDAITTYSATQARFPYQL